MNNIFTKQNVKIIKITFKMYASRAESNEKKYMITNNNDNNNNNFNCIIFIL